MGLLRKIRRGKILFPYDAVPVDFIPNVYCDPGSFLMSSIPTLDQFRFHHVLEETSGVVLVFFSGPHCGACRHLRGVLQDCVASIGGLTVFEVDAARDLTLARALNVFHLPSMFLYRDGHFHCQLHSEARPEKLRAAIDAALQRPPEEEP